MLWRRLAAEFLGSAFLAAIVIGSGIAAQRLSPGETGLQLLENAAATAAGLFAIILMFGPVSGGHFNPVVSFVDAAFGGLSWRDAAAYLPAQVAGCIAGAVVANLMFALPAVSISTKHRATAAHFLSEVVATAGLMLVIFALARSGRSRPPRRRSAPISARPISSPPPPASPTRRSPSAACSPTPSLASPRPRCRRSSPPRSCGGAAGGGDHPGRSTPRITPAQAADIVVPHQAKARTRPGRPGRPRRRRPGAQPGGDRQQPGTYGPTWELPCTWS